MPDSRIDIAINLQVQGEAVQRLKDLNAELRRIPAEAQRVSASLGTEVFQRGWAGRRGVENDLEALYERQKALPLEIKEAQRAAAVQYLRLDLPVPRMPIQEELERLTGVTREPDEADLILPRNERNMRSAFSPEAFSEARRTMPAYKTSADTTAQEEAAARLTAATQREANRQAEAADRAQQKQTESAQREAAKRIRESEREAEQIARDQQKQQQEAERQAAAQERQRSQTFASMSGWVDKQVRAQEQASERGYQAADRDVQRETAARKRQAEADANAAIRAAAARDAAVQRSIQFDEQISHRGVSTATGEPRVLSYTELENAHYRLQRFRAEQEARGATGIFGRLNRQGALEAQAAVINTVQALASGMNPVHVAIMESTQLGGAAVQGNLITLQQIFTAMTSPVGMLVTGLTAVAAATVAWTASIARANAQMANFQNLAALQGRDAVAARGTAAEMADRIRTSGFLGRMESRETAITVGSIPNISEETRDVLGRSAEAIGRARFGGNQEEANKFIQSTFGDTSKLKSFVDEMGLVEGKTRETFNAAVAIGDSFTAASIAAGALSERLGPTIDALQRARESQGVIGRNIDIFGLRGEAELARQTGSFNMFSLYQTPAFRPGTTAPHPEIRQGMEAAERQLKVEQEINGLLLQRQNLQSAITRAAGQPVQAEFQRALVENEQRIGAAHTPEEERTHNRRMANLERQLQAAERAAAHDISQASHVGEVQRQIQQEITNYRTSEAARRAGIAVQESEKEIQAAQQTEERRHAMAQRTIDIMLQQSNLERARIGPANISAQREIVQRNVTAIEGNRDVDQSVIIGQRTELVNLSRQERLQLEDLNIAQLRQGELLLQAKEDLAGIVTLRRAEAAIIEGSRDRTPADRVQARTNVLQSQIQAETQARRLEVQAVDSLGQAEQRRLQTLSSLASLSVAQGDSTTAQAAAAEQTLTTQATNAQAARLSALVANGNLERSERIRINEQLAQLYEQDAQKQIELQTRITQSIRAENDRRVENFKNFFSSVESASADLLTAGLLKSQTKEQALKSFATSVVTSFVKETESMASKFAGKGLASIMGVKLGEGEDSSISNVLAKGVGSMLGLTSAEPKLDQAAIAQRMQQAGDAQKQAGDLMLQAAREMHAKAGESPYRGGRGTEFSTDVVRETESRVTTATPGAPTSGDPRGMIPVIRSSAEKYGVDPDVAIKVARSEGLGTFSGDKGTSFGAFQLHVGGGLGDEFKRDTGLDPSDPKNEAATIDYAMRRLSSTGWTPYHGAARVGVGAREGIGVAPVKPLDEPVGQRRLPLDTLYNSKGEPYSRELLTMSAEEKANVASAEKALKAGTFWGPQNVAGTRTSEALKVDPSSVAQGVLDAQQQYVGEFKASVQEGMVSGQQAAVQATMQDSQQTQRGTESTSTNSERLSDATSSIKELNQTLQQKTNVSHSGSSLSSAAEKPEKALDGVTASAGTAQQGLSLLSSATGLASSAALLFGKNLSPTGKAIVGGVGLASNLLSFGTKAASLFAAPATGGLSLAGLFSEHGAIVESAAGGIYVRETSLSSSITSGLRSMASRGNTSSFSSARMVPSRTVANAVADGKGGRLIVAHDGEMVVPRAETSLILSSMNSSISSAEDGLLLNDSSRFDSSGTVRVPRNLGVSIREAISNNFSTPRTNNNVNNAPVLNYSPNMTGYHPYRSRADMEGMLRQHGSTIMGYLERAIRNGNYPARSF